MAWLYVFGPRRASFAAGDQPHDVHTPHLAVQYATAMGLNVVAIDVDDSKLAFARSLGATLTVNALTADPVAVVKKEIGGAHGVLVTAVSRKAFAQATGLLRRGGTMVLNGLPPGDFPISIFDVVLNGTTIRGSIVGTRLDLKESLEFATAGKVKAIVKAEPLENINDIFDRMRTGRIEGRIVVDYHMQGASLAHENIESLVAV